MNDFGASGGLGGTDFVAQPPRENGPWKISSIQVRSGSRIDSIEVFWTNSSGDIHASPRYGGSGGEEDEFPIDSGDYLVRIEGSLGFIENESSYPRLFSLQLFTQNGKSSPVFGKATEAKFHYDGIPGYQITGLFGRSGSAIDALGVSIDRE
jgi:hypothetical protein